VRRGRAANIPQTNKQNVNSQNLPLEYFPYFKGVKINGDGIQSI
jgi:hypothetical protein